MSVRPVGNSSDQDYTQTFPMAAWFSMAGLAESSMECPVLLQPMKSTGMNQLHAPHSFVPCGHPISLSAAKIILASANPKCPLCKITVNGHIPNFGMQDLIGSVTKILERLKWTSECLDKRNKEAASRAGAAPQAQLTMSAPVFHLQPTNPSQFEKTRAGNLDVSDCWRPQTPEENEEYPDFDRRCAFKDKSQKGLFSYVRVNGRKDNGAIEIMVTSVEKDLFERFLKDWGRFRPSSEQREEKKGERSTIAQGKKVQMGKFIAKSFEDICWVIEMMEMPGHFTPSQNYLEAVDFLKKLAKDSWPNVERDCGAYCEKAKQINLTNRRLILDQNRQDRFEGYTDEEHAQALALQKSFEAQQKDAEMAAMLQAEERLRPKTDQDALLAATLQAQWANER